METTLQALVIAAQAGDLEAFGHIVRRFQGMAYAGAYAVVGDAQLAEDVAQEAFMEAYANLPKLRDPAAFPGWFRRIIFKQSDRLIRGKRVSTMPLDITIDVPVMELNPSLLVERREMSARVWRAVEALPEHERLVTVLFYSTGYALKEIAVFLEVPVTTVKKRLYNARQRLKDDLIDYVRESLHEARPVGVEGFSEQVQVQVLAKRKVQTMHTEHSINIPVGTVVLGRVLNAQGEAIDQRGPFGSDVQRVPLIPLSVDEKPVPDQMLETGIKPIDLLAPLPRGGVLALLSEPGLGKMVVMEEIMHNFITHRHGYIVCVVTGESTYEATEMRDMIRDIEAEDRVVMIFEPRKHNGQSGQKKAGNGQQEQRLLRMGLTIASTFADAGNEVMLIVGKDVMGSDNHATLQGLKQTVRAKGVTTFLFELPGNIQPMAHSDLLKELDGQIVFSHAMKQQNLWPAIDRLSTQSRLLESNVLDAEHVRVVQEVRQLLGRYDELRQEAGAGQLSTDDELDWKRAQKIQLFLTQPFTVAEAYTGLSGVYLPVEETVRSFRVLLEGRYDDVPAQAFYFVGRVEEALEKGGK